MAHERPSHLQRRIPAWLVAKDERLRGTIAVTLAVGDADRRPPLQAIANRSNYEGIPTLCRKGTC